MKVDKRMTKTLAGLMTCVLGLVLVIGSSCSSGAPTAASVTEEITASKTVLAIDADTLSMGIETRADLLNSACGPQNRSPLLEGIQQQ